MQKTGGQNKRYRYNRLSLKLHDEKKKKEPWHYWKPKKRSKKDKVYIKKYQFSHGKWYRVE